MQRTSLPKAVRVKVDLVLSSGFLAFARQAGFLAGVEELGVKVDGICGVSSGALAGALWAAGHPAQEIAAILVESAPLWHVRPHGAPWRGLFHLDPMQARLRDLLPARIEQLQRPFAVGVMGRGGARVLLESGPLPEAVAASCAVPYLFRPVTVGGVAYQDGGAIDRTFLGPWRARRPEAPVVLHLVDGRGGEMEVPTGPGLTVVRNRRSGARLWSLGDFVGQFEEARENTLTALEAALFGVPDAPHPG